MMRIAQSGDVRLPRFNARVSGRVGNVGVEIVFVAKIGKMMAELVHEDLNASRIVNAHSRVKTEYAAITVLIGIHDNSHHIVRRKRRHGANGAIVERERITRLTENIELSPVQRVLVNAGGGM